MTYSYRKMPRFVQESSAETDQHWCVVLVPDTESETVTFMQGKETWGLTETEAKRKADELNNKLGKSSSAGL
jgi:hypothetical protein